MAYIYSTSVTLIVLRGGGKRNIIVVVVCDYIYIGANLSNEVIITLFIVAS